MHIQFFVPALLWPGLQTQQPTRGVATPALERLLGLGQAELGPGGTAEAALLGLFGLPPETSLGALRHIGEDGSEAGGGHTLCADPVGLRFARDHLLLTDAGELEVGADEAAALVQGLNESFGDAGRFEMGSPARWYLHAQAPPRARFAPLAEVVGRPVAHFMPTGEAAAEWHRLINEIQVWMHNHPVNQAREEAGQPTINSLWPWGAGAPPSAARAPAAVVAGEGPLLAGLCRAAGAALRPLRLEALPAEADSALVCLEGAAAAARHLDLGGWQQALARFEADWRAPALQALRAGRLRSIGLLAPGDRATLRVRLERPRLWPFWKRPRPLQTYIERQQ